MGEEQVLPRVKIMEALDDTALSVCQYTDGDWPDEDQAKAELDRRLSLCGLFQSFPEVTGEYTQPRYQAERKDPRIDRLLIPTARLVTAGWRYGVVGVECKKSGMKLGPVVAQCQDYGRAVFKSPRSGISVTCEWVFIWPLEKPRGDIASVMTQNRIGGLWGSGYNLLNFHSACGSILRVTDAERFDIGKVTAGRRTGSR